MIQTIDIGNLTAEKAGELLGNLGVESAKIRPCIGLWKGQMENSVEITLYDTTESDARMLLELIGRMMPDEEAFGLNQEAITNPWLEGTSHSIRERFSKTVGLRAAMRLA